MDYEITIDGETRQVHVVRDRDDGWRVQIDDGPVQHVTGGKLGHGEWALRRDGVRRVVGVAVRGERVNVQLQGRDVSAAVLDARKAALRLGAGGAQGLVTTAMPGVVVRLLVAVGDEVVKGQPVIVVEAMKMENEFKAPMDGVIAAIHVEPGVPLESGAALLTIE